MKTWGIDFEGYKKREDAKAWKTRRQAVTEQIFRIGSVVAFYF